MLSLLLSCAARCVHKKLKYSTSQHRVCTAHQCQCQWQPIKKKETDLMVLRLPSSFEAGRCDRGGRTNLNKVDISGLTTQQMKECYDLKTSSLWAFCPPHPVAQQELIIFDCPVLLHRDTSCFARHTLPRHFRSSCPHSGASLTDCPLREQSGQV